MQELSFFLKTSAHSNRLCYRQSMCAESKDRCSAQVPILCMKNATVRTFWKMFACLLPNFHLSVTTQSCVEHRSRSFCF